MKLAKLDDMVKGWFVGDFEPTLLHSKEAEVAIKHYKAGDSEAEHVHKVGTEVTAVVSGEVEMCGKVFGAGDLILLEPGEPCAFRAITDAVTVVVKTPSVKGDKFVL